MESEAGDPKHSMPAKSTTLRHVLRQNENIKRNVEQAAGELNSVNEILKEDNNASVPVQKIKEAIAQNEDVEHKVVKVANDLHQVNAQLVEEVAERVVVESELAETKTDLAEVRDDLSKAQAKEQKTRNMALQDPLTGIPNRAALEQALDHGLIQARRHGWGLAVLFIDLDKFKNINDSYGHAVGDKVLIMVANRLQASLREEDMASRWGGDEFVCLLLEVKQEADATRLAEEMVSRIAEACELHGTVLSVNASIGIALYPADGETADSLLKNADSAMYKAKGTKKRVALFRESDP